MYDTLTDCTEVDPETQNMLQELETVMELILCCVDENSRVALAQDEYLVWYNGKVEQYENA